MRKTKIICTIGPASATEEVLTEMCHAGMNVARLNFSHGTHPEHQEKIDLVKRVREKLNLPIAIMLDTKGPEYRIGTFKDGKVEIADGATFVFTTEDVEGDELGIYLEATDSLGYLHRMLLHHWKVSNGATAEAVNGSEFIYDPNGVQIFP